jgi:guanosine-3',5'-bis(diphosphate) 3'-pyrophosphohydrolase
LFSPDFAWPRVTLSFEDFINAPSINGYRGLHTTIILPSGTRVRCKIRTHEMHDYARRGVTTLCFTQKSGVLELLSWTKSISPLADSTEGKSDSFFESLKSEILGESIIVYGPGDESVQLPKGSTALDGMVQLFPDRALKLQTILVNGKEVPFSTPLTQAAALNATYAEHNTVQRDWLQSVQTHLAAVSIRDALVRQSEQKKIEVGKRLLQEAMTERKRGFLEEFDERQLKRRLELIGETSLQNVYIAIAEGRLEATEAYDAIFGTRSDSGTHLQKTLVRYTIDMSDLQAMDGVNHCHRKHGAALDSIRYVRMRNGDAQVVVRGRFTDEQLLAFTRELTLARAAPQRGHPSGRALQIK